MTIHLTGFGKFGNIEDNPTMHHARFIEENLDKLGPPVAIDHIQIVGVSMEDCEDSLQQIRQKIEASDSSHHLILNMGVAAGRKNICLERIARNIADFRIPDMRGNKPRNQPICKDLSVDDCCMTTLELENAIDSLNDDKICISDDAGEYICNYMFYRALETAKSLCTDGRKCHAMFLHMPAFKSLSEEK